MHAALESVVTTFLKLWIASEHKNKDWYLNRNKKRILSERLEKIKPPMEITRAARSIDQLALWKASELRNFLLYYSLSSLNGLLPSKYLKHWFLFVYSMTIFLREQFSQNEFLKARAALVNFVKDIIVVYPHCNFLYTFNVHLLLHVPKAMSNFDGLWASSTFPYEHFNGVLTKFIKGSQSVPQQICRSYLRLQNVSNMSARIFNYENCFQNGKKLYKSMLSKYCSSQNSFAYSEELRLFGVPKNYVLSLAEKVSIQQLLGCNIQNSAQSFRRLIAQGTVFHARSYASLSVRNNSICNTTDNIFMSIEHILIITCTSSNEKHCVLVGELLENLNVELYHNREIEISSLKFINVCRESGIIISRTPDSLKSKCVCIPHENVTYVIPLVNKLERD